MMKISVNASWQHGTPATRVRTAKHEFVIDEPTQSGGDGLAANPMEMLLGAVAGCFIGVGRMVAKERGMRLDHIKMHVEEDLDPAGMAGDNPSVRPGAQDVRLIVEVGTAAPREDVEAWLAETERRCPVADTIRSAVPVSVRLKGIS